MASKPLYFNISSSRTVERCFTLAVNHHICIFSQPPLVNLLFVFDSVMFCFVSVTFPVVLLQPVTKWSTNLPKSEALLDKTFSRQKINISLRCWPSLLPNLKGWRKYRNIYLRASWLFLQTVKVFFCQSFGDFGPLCPNVCLAAQ